MKLDIEEDAKKRREEKLEELERSTAQYNQLDTEAETLDHRLWITHGRMALMWGTAANVYSRGRETA